MSRIDRQWLPVCNYFLLQVIASHSCCESQRRKHSWSVPFWPQMPGKEVTVLWHKLFMVNKITDSQTRIPRTSEDCIVLHWLCMVWLAFYSKRIYIYTHINIYVCIYIFYLKPVLSIFSSLLSVKLFLNVSSPVQSTKELRQSCMHVFEDYL